MSIESTIHLEDEFTQPLKNLCTEAWNADSAVTALGKSLWKNAKMSKDISDSLYSMNSESEELSDNLQDNAEYAEDLYDNMSECNEEMEDYNNNLDETETKLDKLKRGAKRFFEIFRTPLILLNIVKSSTIDMLKQVKDSYVKFFDKMFESIGNSIDDISITNKMDAMFGKAGLNARERAFEIANDIGDDAAMIAQLSAKAAYQGIGQEDFERMMHLADKVGKLSMGETTEGAANTLLQNIKSGHDAGSIAQLFGGGQKMERQLRRAGYERALNRGDLSKALEIAEKIAEQAGLTEERYAKANDSIAENYKTIMSTVNNVKHRFAEIFNQMLAPTVKKIKDFLSSETFKKLLNFAERGIIVLGKVVNYIGEQMIDKLTWVIDKAGDLFEFVKENIGIIGVSIGTLIIGKAIAVNAAISKFSGAAAGIAKFFLVSGEIVGPFLVVAGIVAGLGKWFAEATGAADEFGTTLVGGIAGLYESAVTSFENLFIKIENIGKTVKIGALRLKLGIINGAKSVFQKISDGFVELMQKIADNPIAKELFDFNLDDIKTSISVKLDDKFNIKEIEDEILEVQNSMREEVDGTERITEALKTNGASTFGKVFEIANNIKKYMPDLKELWDIQGNTKTSADYLKQMNEQEEELRWLKAFSDRQIIDRYNQSTSNTRNVNIYGASQSAVNYAASLNASRYPRKAATL